MQNYNNKFKNITIGYLIVFGSFMLLASNYFGKMKDRVFANMNMEMYSLSSNLLQIEEKEEEEVKEDNPPPVSNEYYIGTLEIPKINLKRGFVDPNSKDNDVSINIEIVKTSDMPDVRHGNFILAAHSGNSYVSYFQYLYNLEVGDIAIIEYKGIKYTYKIKNIYLQKKTGTIGIYRDMSKTTLTLVTCTQDDEEHQTIYIAELLSKN